MEDMKGKVAIITGATSGIGWEAALLYAKHGIKVVAAGRSEQAGTLLIKAIIEHGGEAIFVKTDVANTHEVKNLVERAKSHFGGVDFALNSAGIEGNLNPLVNLSDEDWDSVINTNLKGMWHSLKYEIPAIIERGGGSIVNISTNLTEAGITGAAAYTASKAGVEALSMVSAIEYGQYGVRVNIISPGATDTPMLRRILSGHQLERLKVANPLGSLGTAKEVANAALWLSSPLATHINGAKITIDGGYSLLSH